ncbi:MAG TPA: HlyD family efflux transporter periplasmic adaptor subunit [Bacteroidia bacterium]|nr:HlyD family efflux transporter periplasmic adaptor subunit [Bacteroidia bacterium]
MKTNLILSIAAAAFLFSCNSAEKKADAYGNFEAVETIVSAQGQGQLLSFDVEEGQQLKVNENVGLIDTFALYLKKKEIDATIRSLNKKVPDSEAQLAVVRQQIENAMREKTRIENLVKADAAPSKGLDDINEQIAVLQQQEKALQSQLQTQSSTILSGGDPLAVEKMQVDDLLAKCSIINPVSGTVTTKFAERGEVVAPGKPLYRIADLQNMILRAYVSGDQLSKVKIGQHVKVSIDDGSGKMKTYDGTVEWISDKAEFTPKLIQTKEERVNLVYAVKIRVVNDGAIKSGMPGEVNF